MQKTSGRNSSVHTKSVHNKKGLFLIILLFLGLIFFSRHESVNTIDCSPDIIASEPDIIILGAWWCRNCYQAKKHFQRNKISYCEYDMENTAIGKQMYDEHGGGAVPILLIGSYKLTGFSVQQVERALSLSFPEKYPDQ